MWSVRLLSAGRGAALSPPPVSNMVPRGPGVPGGPGTWIEELGKSDTERLRRQREGWGRVGRERGKCGESKTYREGGRGRGVGGVSEWVGG